MYDYLIGSGILGLIWAPFFIWRKDLRQIMLWSGIYYIIICSVGFAVLYLLRIPPEYRINPGYWSPPSLWDLNNITQGYGVEDALYMFFVAGITTATYKTFTKQKVSTKPEADLKRPHAMLGGLVLGAAVCIAFRLNEIYFMILFDLFSALIMLAYRRDLIKQSVYSGLLFMLVYGGFFQVFRALFPHFLPLYYHTQHTSGLSLFTIPIEEYLYALTFGFLWAPLYEYKRKLKIIPIEKQV